jgi:hypothetical protein
LQNELIFYSGSIPATKFTGLIILNKSAQR